MLRVFDKPPRSYVGEGVVKLMTDFQRTGVVLFVNSSNLMEINLIKFKTSKVPNFEKPRGTRLFVKIGCIILTTHSVGFVVW